MRRHGAIYDRGGLLLASRTVIDVDRYRLAQGILSLSDGGGRRLTVPACRRYRKRTGLAQNLLGQLIVRDSQRYSAPGFTEIPGQRWLCGKDQGQGTGPEGLCQLTSGGRNIYRKSIKYLNAADQHRRW